MFHVYILFSEKLDVYYKGCTQGVEIRLTNHLLGRSKFTSKTKDWVLVYQKSFETKKEVLIEEKRIKKLNRLALEKLINS